MASRRRHRLPSPAAAHGLPPNPAAAGFCSAMAATPNVLVLVQQLRSRQRSQQISAAQQLGRIADNACSAATSDAVAAAGGVRTLLHLLKSRSEPLQAAAAFALCSLAGSSEPCHRSVEAGGIEIIIRLLNTSNWPCVLESGAAALYSLTSGAAFPAERARAVAAGGIVSLERLLRSHGGSVATEAACALANLVIGSRPNQTAAAGAIPSLVTHLHAAAEGLQLAAASALVNLTTEHVRNSRAAVQAGAVTALAHRACSSQSAVRLSAMQALVNIFLFALDDQEPALVHAAQLAAAGALHSAVEQLGSNDVALQDGAARLLGCLSQHTSCCDLLLEAGAIAPLAQLLSPAADAAVRYSAAEALAYLARCDHVHGAILAAGGTRALVQLLHRTASHSADADVLYVVCDALASLTMSADQRQLVIEAGGLQPLLRCLRGSRKGVALAALCNLASDHAAMVAAAGGVAAVTQLLSSSSSSAWAQTRAALCLNHVALARPLLLDAQAAAACAAALVDAAGACANSDKPEAVELCQTAAAVVHALWCSSAAIRQAVRSALEQQVQEGCPPQSGVATNLLQILPTNEECSEAEE